MRLKDEQRVLRRHACFVRSSPSSPVLCAAQSLFLHAVAFSKGNRDRWRQTSNLSFTRCTGAGLRLQRHKIHQSEDTCMQERVSLGEPALALAIGALAERAIFSSGERFGVCLTASALRRRPMNCVLLLLACAWCSKHLLALRCMFAFFLLRGSR